jgi:hypothetical protein
MSNAAGPRARSSSRWSEDCARLSHRHEGDSVSVSSDFRNGSMTHGRGHKTDTSARTHAVTTGTEPLDESGRFAGQPVPDVSDRDPFFPCFRSMVRKGSSVRVRLRASAEPRYGAGFALKRDGLSGAGDRPAGNGLGNTRPAEYSANEARWLRPRDGSSTSKPQRLSHVANSRSD